jgi:hypothetical protein
MSKLSSQFKTTVKRILKEEVEKSDTGKEIYKRVPEVNRGTDLKDVTPHKVDTKSKEEILEDITKLVKEINKSYSVDWDDHDDIRVIAEDKFKIRIIPKWENNYCVEAYTKNEDRVYISGLDLDGVKKFLKENLKNQETNTEKAYKKSTDNEKEKSIDAPDKGLNQKDKLTSKKVGSTSNKNKDFNEDLEKKHPQNTPMEELKNQKKQDEHPIKGTKPDYKFPKQKNNKLVIKQK